MRTVMEKGGDAASVPLARGRAAFTRNRGLCSIFLVSWDLVFIGSFHVLRMVSYVFLPDVQSHNSRYS